MVSNIKEGDIVKGKDDEDTQVVRVMEVIYGRHGVKQKGEGNVSLVDSSPGSIYDKVRSATSRTYSPERVYIAHTDKIRTNQTARAIALAKTGQRRPKNLEELAESDYRGISSQEDTRLGFSEGSYSEKEWKNRGAVNYINYFLQNREAVQIGGDLVEPQLSVESRFQDALRDGIEKVLSGQFDCSILTTHQYGSETLRGIANGRGSRAKSVDDLGGGFDMEEFDVIRIAELADGTYKCYVEYKGNVQERKLKDIMGYDIKGDKARAKEHARIIREEDEVNDRMNPQLQNLSPAAFGRN